jgi:C1A family cysteine protease
MIYNLAVALAVIAVASANLHDRAFYEEKFFEWVQEHKMEVGTGSSFVKMLQNFADNHDVIENHNSGNHSYQLGHNKFSHMSTAEWKEFVGRGGLTRPTLRAEKTFAAPADVSTLASEIDWVTGGLVTEVKDQGQCGSCWSFSATGALEGAWKAAGNELQSFAPQQFVDCDTFKNSANRGKDMGCNGGLMDSAFAWAQKNNGLCKWESYSYKAEQGSCAESSCKQELASPKSFSDVTPKDAGALMAALNKQTVAIAIEADTKEFQLYKSGVFSAPCGANLDHGVLAVGYGSDSVGGDFWKVKNSWGTGWGEAGYIRFTRAEIKGQPEGQCGILAQPSFPTY